MATTLQDSLRRLIAKGKTEQALDELSDSLHNSDVGDTLTTPCPIQTTHLSKNRSMTIRFMGICRLSSSLAASCTSLLRA